MPKIHLILPNPTKQDIERFRSYVNTKDISECWEWKAGNRKRGGETGYGAFHYQRKTVSTHRFAYFIHHKIDPSENLVLHTCDNPPCCNPHHLFLGTHADNVADKISKGRQAKGERVTNKITHRGDDHWTRISPEKVLRGSSHPLVKNPSLAARGERNGSHTHPECVLKGEQVGNSKLTENQVREIRKEREESNTTMKGLAAKFGLTASTVNDILKKKRWKHIV